MRQTLNCWTNLLRFRKIHRRGFFRHARFAPCRQRHRLYAHDDARGRPRYLVFQPQTANRRRYRAGADYQKSARPRGLAVRRLVFETTVVRLNAEFTHLDLKYKDFPSRKSSAH